MVNNTVNIITKTNYYTDSIIDLVYLRGFLQ